MPWSMCPMVPTFTNGLVRSNTAFAIAFLSIYVLRQSGHPRRATRPGSQPAITVGSDTRGNEDVQSGQKCVADESFECYRR
jgi:hypothetical protein